MYKLKLLPDVETDFLILRGKYSGLDTKLLLLMTDPLSQKPYLYGKNEYYINAGNRHAFIYKVTGKTVNVVRLLRQNYLHKILNGKLSN